MRLDRRSLLHLSAATTAAGLTASIRRALAIPAHHRTGTIEDVEHIVILMQENRAFDHYLGSLRGVRGYSDPRPAILPSGKDVFHQADASGKVTLPFHPDAVNLGLTFIEDLAHDWTTTHAAWNHGKYDGWIPAKTTTSMAYLTREDIPFHYALADAFTVCDAYHCSILSSTDPNRYYMWTGWVGNDGKGGGPVVDNAEAGYDWATYPERMQAAGISWRVYQDIGEGLTAAGSWGWTGDNAYIGNYGDNSLLYFHQYQNAQPGTPLADRAKTGTDISASGTLFEQFAADVKNNTLPQVSWIAAPEAYTEHPNWPANYGAYYVSQILDALTANPDVWSKTVFILNFDENDGFFDHIVPPNPAFSAAEGGSTVSVENEYFPGSSEYAAGPYGLGVRVPCFIISPWSRGGFVNSQVFDHTSIIRFIEQRFGANNPQLTEPNITPWRRAVSGDLTSAFNFATPNAHVPRLPETASYAPPDRVRHPDYSPVPPAVGTQPVQERGLRLARALPYATDVAVRATSAGITLTYANTGAAGVVFQRRSTDGSTPRSFTVTPGKTLSETVNASTYDLSVFGPNGFFRHFKSGGTAPELAVSAAPNPRGALELRVTNLSARGIALWVHDNYLGQDVLVREIGGGSSLSLPIDTNHLLGWYDFTLRGGTFSFQLAGHVETGADTIADPNLGGVSVWELPIELAKLR